MIAENHLIPNESNDKVRSAEHDISYFRIPWQGPQWVVYPEPCAYAAFPRYIALNIHSTRNKKFYPVDPFFQPPFVREDKNILDVAEIEPKSSCIASRCSGHHKSCLLALFNRRLIYFLPQTRVGWACYCPR